MSEKTLSKASPVHIRELADWDVITRCIGSIDEVEEDALTVFFDTHRGTFPRLSREISEYLLGDGSDLELLA